MLIMVWTCMELLNSMNSHFGSIGFNIYEPRALNHVKTYKAVSSTVLTS